MKFVPIVAPAKKCTVTDEVCLEGSISAVLRVSALLGCVVVIIIKTNKLILFISYADVSFLFVVTLMWILNRK